MDPTHVKAELRRFRDSAFDATSARARTAASGSGFLSNIDARRTPMFEFVLWPGERCTIEGTAQRPISDDDASMLSRPFEPHYSQSKDR